MLGPELLVDVPAALWNAGPRDTGARTSVIVGMLGLELLVDVPAALWNAGPRDTGARTSGVVRMLGPEILVDVPAALCERWAQGFDARAGTSAGQPTRELVGRETVFCVR